ncbi:MAG: hypothetical protein AAF533_30100 [Acidobacteriota bacterium]
MSRPRRVAVALATTLALVVTSCGVDDGARVRMQDNVTGDSDSSATDDD